MSATPASAKDFTLSSPDVAEGQRLAARHVFEGFGCKGGNLSPELTWSGAPKGTKSYAVSVYDPDAPTGSGWWHWNVFNLPSETSTLPRGATATQGLPKGARQATNDYGAMGFGGACPPPGEVHRYVITVYALDVKTLEVPKNASNALIGFMTRAHSLASEHITAVFSR
ncbi:MAG: YbhB/YbcL family Raf kinase inhibitor-like protein [Myxococcota bacterium]